MNSAKDKRIRMPCMAILLTVCFRLPFSGETHADSVIASHSSVGLQLLAGMTNHVWADEPAMGHVFDRWTGDANLLANLYASHTTLTMPATNVALTATFKSTPSWFPTTNTLNSVAAGDPNAVNLVYYFPSNAVGLIFLFNGAIAKAGAFFTEGESLTFMRDAVAAGYAVAALDSGGGPGRSWDTTFSPANPDVSNVQASITFFIAAGLATTNTPRFAAGMSAGGFFAPLPAYYLKFNACALWCSSGAPKSSATTVFNVTTVPTIWNLARNDDLYSHTAFWSDSSNNLALLAQRGTAGELRENLPSPVYPRRFTRVQGLSAGDSQIIHDRLKTAGLLDTNEFLVSTPFNNSNQWQSVITDYAPYFAEIQNQLNTCHAEHHFFSDFGNATLQFFGAHRPASRRERISSLERQADGAVRLTIAGEPGRDYRVQASIELGAWASIFTNLYTGGTFDCLDANAVAMPFRFYRTVSP